MFTCTKCYHTFKNDMSVKEGDRCPIYGCYGRVYDIDEILLPVVIVLNEKGYETTGCCSGHFNRKSPHEFYLQFDLSVGKDKLISLPHDFKIYSDEQFLEIQLKEGFNSTDKIDLHKEILSSAISLLEWAKSLPQIYEFTIGIETKTDYEAFEVEDILREEFNFGCVDIEDPDNSGSNYDVLDIPPYIVRGYTRTYIEDDPELRSKISKAISAE